MPRQNAVLPGAPGRATSRLAPFALATILVAAFAGAAPPPASAALTTAQTTAQTTAATPVPISAPISDPVSPVKQVIVKYRGGAGGAVRSQSLSARGLHVRAQLSLTGASVVDVPVGTSAAKAAAQLQLDPNVVYAVPDVVRKPSTNDKYFTQQWGLLNTGQILPAGSGAGVATAGVDVDATGAWSLPQGSAGVTVAIIDTGIQVTHPDLGDAIWDNPGETAGNGIDDDRNGFVDDVHGWDFVNGTGSVYSATDGDVHGTHVAGIVGAVADNGIGVAGLARGAKIMSVKFLAAGGGTDINAIRAITYAKANGAQVINASWGESVANDPGAASPALRDAIASCGCVFVAAAGNASAGNVGADMDDSAQASYPASYDLPNLLSVAAIDDQGNMPTFSNYGGSTVDLAAPGQGVLSTVPGGYQFLHGTSMATPFVTAVAALMLSVAPSMAPAAVVQGIRDGARPMPLLAGRVRTGGMLDAGATMRALGVPVPGPVTPVTRLLGTDRYATAAAVAGEFAPGVATAYVASGTGFADALAGAALAGSQHVPVLLTTPGSLPAATAAALTRLQPARIVVLGGTGAVSAAVAAELAGFTSGGVTRLLGTDRYATAAAVAGEFAPGVATAYVASGAGFADALAGAALAGSQHVPVLLTTPGSLPAATATALTRLQPARIVVLGGTGAVSDAVAAELTGFTSGGVTRLRGTDRYATAAAVAGEFAPAVATAFVASGTGFADALAGAALAGSQHVPVLLTTPGSLPAATATALTRLQPARIVVLGGTAAVSANVAATLTGQ